MERDSDSSSTECAFDVGIDDSDDDSFLRSPQRLSDQEISALPLPPALLELPDVPRATAPTRTQF